MAIGEKTAVADADEAGELVVLLSDQGSEVDLDEYLGQRVKVRGRTEATLEGDRPLLHVEEVQVESR